MQEILQEPKMNRHPGPTKQGESEEERMANAPYCLDCKQPRVLLKLEPFRRMTMRACTNKECFHYTDLNKLFSWRL